MRHIYLFLFIGLLLLLTACSSIVGAIIGEQPVTNLFGLNDREVIFDLSGGQQTSEELSPAQDVSLLINVPLVDIPFNDIGDLNFPLGAVPKAASEELGISPVVEVTSASSEATFPTRLGLTNPELDLIMKDGSGTPSVRQRLKSPEITVTFNKSSCEVTDAGTVCNYQADKPQEELYFFTVLLEGQDFDTLFNDILQAGDKTNTASGVVTLRVSTSVENIPPIPGDSSFKLILKTRNGKIDFSG
jgi:hypothetical protein